MMMGEKEEALLERAEVEEKDYNWMEAAKLYEQTAKSFLDNNMMEKAAESHYRLGSAYYRASDSAETAEEHAELIKNTVRTFKKAANLYKQTGNKPKELECKAFELFASSIIMNSILEVKKTSNKAYESFIEVSDLYFKENNQESYIRTLIYASYILGLNVMLCSDPKEIEEYFQKVTGIVSKAWKLSRDIKNIQYLAEALCYSGELIGAQIYIKDFKRDYSQKEYLRKNLLMCEQSLRLVEDCDDSRVLGMIYFSSGWISSYFGFHFIEDELEQNKYFDKGFDYLEKSLEFFRRIKDKPLIIYTLFLLNYIASLSGRINYLQKRILNDLNEIVELGKIYRNTYLPWNSISLYLPTMYYANIAQWSFFTPAQRKSYAEKGIEFAQEGMKKLAYGPGFPLLYLFMTMSYSILAYLTTDKDEKDDHIKNMLQYAKKANEIGEKYEGGIARSVGYNSLYRAYKTLADVAKSEEERIKMLTIALEASEKYIKHAVDSRTGIIASRMRLGLLYEDIGILTLNRDMLMKGKELFSQVIRDCLERGYQSYAAATYEYIARIEDRLGNCTPSAKCYMKAQEAYAEYLKKIKYKPLKKRVNVKMNYAKAWSLIESAKAYHKRENHLKAMESYKNAVEILKNLKDINYEAAYYNAWVSQEEAEQLSKLEKHKKAIEQYETTKNAFTDAIKSMEDISKRSKNKFTLERIDKLKKVAKLRIKYCAARSNVEKARILAQQGEHIEAAELFASAASDFRYVCNFFKIERERGELEAVYFLCRAWETMELAEKYEDPERFAEATNLFGKASRLFLDSKMKLLASGNAAFCQALESGCIFDEEPEMDVKTELYSKIRENLRKAATSYRKGGFVSGADWALATSTYFDAAWHLIRADKESELEQRKELLGIGSEYLRSSAELFEKAGNIHKRNEVLERLDIVEKEEKIMFSALNSIKKPTISSSTKGIVAPTCSLEISKSPRLEEIRQFREEEQRFMEERMIKETQRFELGRVKEKLKKKIKIDKVPKKKKVKAIQKSEVSVQDKKELEKIEKEISIDKPKFICVVHKGTIDGTVYICPICKTCYCLTCAYSLKARGEKCWSCNNDINP